LYLLSCALHSRGYENDHRRGRIGRPYLRKGTQRTRSRGRRLRGVGRCRRPRADRRAGRVPARPGFPGLLYVLSCRREPPRLRSARLRAARAPPHSLWTVRPAAWHSQQVAGEHYTDAGACARGRIHRRFLHKWFHALGREGCQGGDRVSANGTPALKIEKLTKTYSNGFLALDGVSLEVEAGKFFGLLGPNGAGKTTLINGVVSLARPDSGSVEVFGKDAFREFREARRMIGVSPQEVNLDKFLTVEETLLFHAGYYGVPKRKARERAEELLERFELAQRRGQRTNTLSGRMKRRVLFARALMHDPKVLFLDEPTAGVDVELRYKLWGYIRELNRGGMTILLTTHYLEEAEALCEEIALINEGNIAAQGSSEDLKERYEARNVEEVYMKVIGHALHR